VTNYDVALQPQTHVWVNCAPDRGKPNFPFINTVNKNINALKFILGINQGLPLIMKFPIPKGGNANLADARQVGVRRFNVNRNEVQRHRSFTL
jgi:hypothetical protein